MPNPDETSRSRASWFRCPGEGTDPRPLRWLTCPIQNLCSFKSDVPPKGQYLFLLDAMSSVERPIVSLFLAWRWPFVAINVQWTKGRYLILRAGFRYDVNWQGYIAPELAVKVEDIPVYF